MTRKSTADKIILLAAEGKIDTLTAVKIAAMIHDERETEICENCVHYQDDCCHNEELYKMDKELDDSNYWFSPTQTFGCKKFKRKLNDT